MENMIDFSTGDPAAAAVTPQPLFKSYDDVVYRHRRTKPKPVGICPLCEEKAPLTESHINPRWAWIKPKQLNGGDQKLQDAQWFYLLCNPCDRMLGKYEGELRSASYLQPGSFDSVLVFREINVALLGILWKASVANRMWVKGSWSLPEETESWIKSILLVLRSDREAGLKIAATACHWRATKFFSQGGINPFDIQVVPYLGDGKGYIGMTYLAGIRWQIIRGMGDFYAAAHVLKKWSTFSQREINVQLDDNVQEKMRKLASRTFDDDHCPCGWIRRTGQGEDTEPKRFSECCKKGWLAEPFTPGFYVTWPKEGPHPLVDVKVYFVPESLTGSDDDIIKLAKERGYALDATISSDQLGFKI